ncbi:MAG: YggS family pyridoxal phosphate-dependent enzyme [Candidatus Pelagibacter sp.]
MHDSINNLILIKKEIQEINPICQLIVVTKTFGIDKIEPIIKTGHKHFGENKVQEALEKWTETKDNNKDIKLHLIGKLQTNKVKLCLPLFDYIHGLDNIKLAEKIANEQVKRNFKPKIFIQINIGDEDQKGGVKQDELLEFYKKIIKEFDLNIIGLMCIPPFVDDTSSFFIKMKVLSEKINLNELSMGMSDDYIQAAKNSATFIRVGSKIMGKRG